MGLSIKNLLALLPIGTYPQVVRGLNRIRSVLLDRFVQHNLGFDHLSREIIEEKYTTVLSKELFEVKKGSIITVWDGTYVYIEKSSNYKFAKATYSMHKNRPLLKMMMITSTSGYILDCFGPYLANGSNNDASIAEDILSDGNDFKSFFKNSDLFVVDRGFRDCFETLDSFGFEVKMPSFLNKAKQHSTQEANDSRMVTKVRWIIESINGVIKQWKYFKNVISNCNLNTIKDDFKIVCAIINKFRVPPARNKINDDKIAAEMKKISKNSNDLKKLIENNKRVKKANLSFDLEKSNFPILTEEYIRNLTFGIYQLKQAKSYTHEHLDDDGQYEFEFINYETNLIKVKIKPLKLFSL